MADLITTKKSNLIDIADAVRLGVNTNKKLAINEMVSAIKELRKPVVENEVNFYDYDGTLLYSYTLEEARALTELPPLPTQETLTCLGWNWTLDDIKELPADSIGADIGALYITADGKTHAYLELVDCGNTSVTMNFTGTINIDWGDGTSDNGVTSPVTHTYPTAGTYVAKLYSESAYQIGGGVYETRFLTDANGSTALVRFHLGENAQLNSNGYGLYAMLCLKYATFAKTQLYKNGMGLCVSLQCIVGGHRYFVGVEGLKNCFSLTVFCAMSNNYIQSQGMRNCSALRRYAVGANSAFSEGQQFYLCYAIREAYLVKANQNVLHSAYALKKVVLKEGMTSIGTCALYGASANSLEIPSTVTTIGAQAFYMAALMRLRFKSTTPPTVENSNAFDNIRAYCVVEVPKGSLEAYQNATNYARIAARMVEVEI